MHQRKEVIPYLGEVPLLEGFDAAGKPRLRKPVRDITLRHLLTHTAGFGYDIWNPEILQYREAMDVPTIGTGLDKALTTPLLFDPGARWQYGIGIDWAGKMVEAVTGQKLGQVMHDDLFAPLGMDSTAFRITPAMRARMARIHHRKADGSLVADLEARDPAGPRIRGGRRWALFDGQRLPEVRAHGAGRRQVGARRRRDEARDGGCDGDECDGRVDGELCSRP